MVVGQMLGLPFTLTAHAYDIYSSKNDLVELTTTNADRIVTISEYNKAKILDKCCTVKEEDIEVIHCGVDLEQFQTVKKENINSKILITSVGSLIEKKGHAYLVQACKELDSQGLDFHCEIIGNGKLKESLQNLIRVLNLEGRVLLVGSLSQNQVRERLRKSDLFVLACVVADDGDRDGIPVAIMEALAMEVPVISTPVSGIPELIKHKKTGLLVPERDSNSLAIAITRLVQERSLGQKFASNGHSLVENEFNILKNVAQLTKLFQQVIVEHEREM